MARNRKEFSSAGNARFLALLAQGWTAKAIADDLNAMGESVSRQTVDVRMREVRGHVATPRGKEAPSFSRDLATLGGIPEPESEPALPEGEPTEEDIEAAAGGGSTVLDETLRSFVEEYKNSPPGPVRQGWGRLILKGLDDREKRTPPAKPDPNEQPDNVKDAKQAMASFQKAVRLVEEKYDPRTA